MFIVPSLMSQTLKSLSIWIISYILIIGALNLSHTQDISFHTLFENHWFILTFFTFFHLLLIFIRYTKDENSKKLKIWLLMIQIYLFLLITLKPFLNFTSIEFLIFYLSCIGCFQSAQIKQLQIKKIATCFRWIIAILMISISLLMIRRSPLDIPSLKNTIPYQMIIPSWSQNKNYPDKITLTNNSTSQTYLLDEQNSPIILLKWKLYHLIYQSMNQEPDNWILIMDPEGNLLKIPSQTELNFSTKESILDFKTLYGKTDFIPISWNSNIILISDLQTNYQNSLNKQIRTTLPPLYKENNKFLYLSYQYTHILSKIFPFYNKNRIIAQEYNTYLNFKRSTWKSSWFINRKEIENNWKNWREKTEILKKINTKFFTLF